MKKIVIALLVVVLLAGLLPIGASLAEDTYATVYSGNEFGVRLREGPATTYGIEIILSSGTTVTVLETGTVWTRVQAGTRTGYMMSKFLVAGGTSSGVTVVNTATVFADNGLRTWLRGSPNGKRLGLYSDGTPVNILEYGDEWCRVMIGSSVGYMMTRYLTVAAAPTPIPAPTFAPLTAVTVNYPYPLVGDTLLPVTTPGNATVTCVWQWVDAAGATTDRSTNSSYAVSSADVGHMIKLTVTGTGSYAGVTVSYTTDPVTASKTVTGVMIKNANKEHTVPVAGDVLSSLVAPSSATVTYSWRVAGVEKATTATYTVLAADAGKTVQVYVTGTGSFTGSASSDASLVVADANTITAVKLSTQYPIVGSAVGAILTPSNASATYTWYVNGAPISTASKYTPNTFDLGDVISVKVTGSGAFTGLAVSADSDPVSRTLLTGVTINNASPSVGATLKAVVTPAAAQDEDSVLYQWYRVEANSTVVPVGSGKEYVVGAADVGYKLYVVASGDGIYGGKVTSAYTALTIASPVLTAVTLDVTAPVAGDTITAKLTPELNATDLAKCTFIWQIGSSRFVGGQSYTVGKSDVGQQIRVQVNPGGGDVVTSAATKAVVNTFAVNAVGFYTTYTETSKVSLSGAPVVGQTIIAKVNPVQADSQVTYTWKAAGVAVGSGATYTVTSADQGKVLIVYATANAGSNYTGTATGTLAAVPRSTAQQIDLKDALIPVAGGVPMYKISGKLTNGVTYNASIAWSPALATNGTFKNKATYTAKLTFSFSSSAYTLGELLHHGANKVSYSGNVATCEFNPLVQTQKVTNLNIAGLTAPVVGAVPDDTITGCSQYKQVLGSPVTWDPDDDKFVVGQSYTATIPLEAEDGYTFLGLKDGSNSTFTVLGASSTLFTIQDSGAKATVKATFGATTSATAAKVTASRTTVPVGSSRKYVQCQAALLNYPGDQSGVSWKWELSGAASTDTEISDGGLVTIALDEASGRTLNITATTENVKNKDGKAYTASVTITTAAETATTGTEVVNIISAPSEITAGSSGTFAAEVLNANNEVVIWSVSAVAGSKHADTKINGDGVLTVSADETVKQLAVTARSVTGVTSVSYVTVVYTKAPTGVTFDAGQKSVAVGKKATFNVAVVNGGTADGTLVFTAKTNAASVDANTVVTLTSTPAMPVTIMKNKTQSVPVEVEVKNDNALIGTEVWVSATYTESGKSYEDMWAFIIVAGEGGDPAYTLNVTPGAGTVLPGVAGTTQTFAAAVTPEVEGAEIKWTVTGGSGITLSPAVGPTTTLTVTSDVTANTEVEITVAYQKGSNPALREVKVPLTLVPAGGDKSKLYISPATIAPLAKDAEVTLKAVYGDGTEADAASLSWTSSVHAVAADPVNGLVKALTPGTTDITVTDSNGVTSGAVTVEVLPSLSISSSKINAMPGEPTPIHISATYDDPLGTLSWTANSTDVSLTNMTNTGADVTVLSSAANGATITITATDGSLTASCSFQIVSGRTLTVTGGTASTPKSGSGSVYEVDESVTLTAKVPADATFKEWTGLSGVTILNGGTVNDPSITIQMPDKSIQATATYSVAYKVTVTNGAINGKASDMVEVGTSVTVTANGAATNTVFTGWTSSEVPASAETSYTFTMPERNVAITANFAKSYKLTVTNGTPSGERYVAGQKVGITANTDPNGGAFKKWTVSNVSIANAELNPGQITMNAGDGAATAVYDYLLTVNGGNGGGRYEAGTAHNIVATPPDGAKFKEWEVTSGTKINNTKASTATVTMTTSDTIVKAVYTYPLTVTSGGNGSVTGSGEFVDGVSTSITATPATGYKFKEWTGDVGFVADQGNPSTTVTINASAVSVTAVFELE